MNIINQDPRSLLVGTLGGPAQSLGRLLKVEIEKEKEVVVKIARERLIKVIVTSETP